MRNLINHIFAWMVALAVALLGAAAAPASAQSTISNVAQIDWQTPQGRFSRLSNQVDLAVDLSAPIAILTTYQLLSSSGSGTQLSVPQTICRGSSGDSVISLDGVWSNTSLSPASVEQTSQIRAGAVSDHPWAFWDVLPTCAELCGQAVPPGIDGISFLPALLGRPQRVHDFLYWEFHEGGFRQAVRAGSWKAVRPGKGRSTELYDLSRDLAERSNVAAEHPSVVKTMEEILTAARTESPDWPSRQ